MISSAKTLPDLQVACEVCLREIPVSEAKSEEAAEYVFYFCGIDCYGAWSAQVAEKASLSE